MHDGIALCVGVTQFDDDFYGSAVRDTISCRKDAERFAEVAKQAKFDVRKLNDPEQATWPNFKIEVQKAADELTPGGHFVLMFSGHGVAVGSNGQFRKWCFFDRSIYRHGTSSIDSALKAFDKRTHITLIVNSCFSGAGMGIGAQPLTPSEATRKHLNDQHSIRLAFRASAAGREFNKFFGPALKAEVIEIDACGPTQVALDGTVATDPTPFIREFTRLVEEQLDANPFHNFDRFVEVIRERSPAEHLPERSPLLDPASAEFEVLGPVRLP